MPSTEIDSAIERLRGRFLDRLIGQHDSASRHFQDARQTKDNSESLRELLSIAHKIAGIAKSVGFEELGHKALKADVVIRKFLDDGDRDHNMKEVSSAVKDFLNCCQKLLEVKKIGNS